MIAEKDMTIEAKEAQKEPVLYELGYHIAPTISSEELNAEVSRVREVLEGSGASIVSEGQPKQVQLAYTIIVDIGEKRHKFDTANFGWMHFKASPESQVTIQHSLRGLSNLIRFIIVSVPSDTASVQRKRRSVFARSSKKDAEEAPQEDGVSKKEIDAEIDKLVVE